MSIFLCEKCEEMRDSDDGCREYDGGKGTPDGAYRSFGLVCSKCMDEEEDDSEPLNPDRPFSPEQQALIDRWEAEADDEQ